MKKITAALMASVFAVMTVPTRAGDISLGDAINIGRIGIGVLNELSNRQAQPREQQQRSAPARSQPNTRSQNPVQRQAALKPKRVPDENVRFVQQKLLDLGYTEVGGADGFWGSNSTMALGLFMADNDMKGDPKASPEIIAALATAQTRQRIADARKASAVVEATMPAATVVDGIVHFEPKPEQKAAEAEHIAAEDAVQPDDFSEDNLKPVVAEAAPAAPVVEQIPAPVIAAETAAAPVPTEEPEPVVVAEPVKTPEPNERKADADGVQKVNGLTVSGDF